MESVPQVLNKMQNIVLGLCASLWRTKGIKCVIAFANTVFMEDNTGHRATSLIAHGSLVPDIRVSLASSFWNPLLLPSHSLTLPQQQRVDIQVHLPSLHNHTHLILVPPQSPTLQVL